MKNCRVIYSVFFSNNLTHDTSFVWKLQELLYNYSKKKHSTSHIKTLEYFSDECARQYKNFNFISLSYQEKDFGIFASFFFPPAMASHLVMALEE